MLCAPDWDRSGSQKGACTCRQRPSGSVSDGAVVALSWRCHDATRASLGRRERACCWGPAWPGARIGVESRAMSRAMSSVWIAGHGRMERPNLRASSVDASGWAAAVRAGGKSIAAWVVAWRTLAHRREILQRSSRALRGRSPSHSGPPGSSRFSRDHDLAVDLAVDLAPSRHRSVVASRPWEPPRTPRQPSTVNQACGDVERSPTRAALATGPRYRLLPCVSLEETSVESHGMLRSVTQMLDARWENLTGRAPKLEGLGPRPRCQSLSSVRVLRGSWVVDAASLLGPDGRPQLLAAGAAARCVPPTNRDGRLDPYLSSMVPLPCTSQQAIGSYRPPCPTSMRQ